METCELNHEDVARVSTFRWCPHCATSLEPIRQRQIREQADARMAQDTAKGKGTVLVTHDVSLDVPRMGYAYVHCTRCLAERPAQVTPEAWARQQASWTPTGIQVWCTRHDINITHMVLSVKGAEKGADT